MKRTILLFIVLADLSTHMFAQETSEHPLAVSIGLAVMPSSFFQEYNFTYSVLSGPAKTTVFSSVGVSYLAFHVEGATSILFSAEAIYGQLATPVIYRFSYRGQMKDEVLFVGFWTKLVVPATVAPFVKIGIGVLKHHRRELYSSQLTNVDLKESRLAVAAGGGIDCAISSSITLSIFGEGALAPSPNFLGFSTFGARVCLAI